MTIRTTSTGRAVATAAAIALGAAGAALCQDTSGVKGKFRGPHITTLATERYVPQTYYTAIPATPPSTPQPLVTAAPVPAPGGGPGGPVSADPLKAPDDPPVTDQSTARWSNYWETHKWEIVPRPAAAGPALPEEPWKNPVLQSLLQGLFDPDPVVAGAAALGLGRTRDPRYEPLLRQAASGRWGRGSQAGGHGGDDVLRGTAILALGLSGSPEGARRLADLVREIEKPAEEPPGGPAPGKPAEPSGEAQEAAELRAALATVGLGLVGLPSDTELLREKAGQQTASPALRVGALLGLSQSVDPRGAEEIHAIGFAPLWHPTFRGIATALLGRAPTEGPSGASRKTEDGRDVPLTWTDILVEWSRAFRGTRSVTVGAALALTRRARPADVGRLADLVAESPDWASRGLLCIALARAAAGSPESARALRILQKEARSGSPIPIRGFALFSMGLLKDPAAVPDLVKVLKAPEEDGEARGAAAVALGLLGARESVPALFEALAWTQGDPGRGLLGAWCAEGLGLVGGADASGVLRRVFEQNREAWRGRAGDAPSRADPHLRRGAGTALAFLGDPTVTGFVQDLRAEDEFLGGGAASALAWARPAAALAELRRAASTGKAGHERGRALAVLGHWRRPSERPDILDIVSDLFPFDAARPYDGFVSLLLDLL
ncbi:MAG: HEAT repeat domain-containing protein [Planctomycetales bacterium]|nr:HEAT repeat domain-containing protein [Planctomycetales bacterium]